MVNYPCSSTLGIFNDGNKCLSNHCSNPTAFRVILNIIGAIKSFQKIIYQYWIIPMIIDLYD